jgi:alanyl-tRNA synthetase
MYNISNMDNNSVSCKFINFFTSHPRNHKEIPSSPLVPENDPTVLFITAGMHPLVPYLLGEQHPLGKRLVDVQKSMRTDDIDEVGDISHFTFFEMLGNWSLGAYFKKEAIGWSFEFLTDKKWLGLDPSKIYVSVFEGDKDAPKDTESINFWKQSFKNAGITADEGSPKKGISQNARIFPYPKAKNWWGPAGTTGPCGPDTEMFYDTGLMLHDKKVHGLICHINCDCGRYVEIWNNVFMQYNKTEDGIFLPLAQKNVDTGMGLERVTAILEWLNGHIPTPDPFLTPLFKSVINKISQISGKEYKEPYIKNIRIIADHTRCAVFLIADGVIPTNKERGYVLRKIIRRAIRIANMLGIEKPFMEDIAAIFIETYKKRYPELVVNKEMIFSQIKLEEVKFQNTLKNGLKEINKIPVLTGKIAFDIYQSFGFPWEMTAEIALEKGQKIDKASFEEEFKKHQSLSRSNTKGIFKGGLQDQSDKTTKLHTATHLLQQALRIVLGNQVRQKGSHITHERLRFDYSHDKKINSVEILKIEELINAKIKENIKIDMAVKSLAAAINEGALTVPNANYPEKVKVYSVGNFSKEVCGGPHVSFTGGLGLFKIIKEEALGSGIRRIYATLS